MGCLGAHYQMLQYFSKHFAVTLAVPFNWQERAEATAAAFDLV